MNTYTVFYKAQVEGRKFLSSTVVRAESKDAAAAIAMQEMASHATKVTSVMLGR